MSTREITTADTVLDLLRQLPPRERLKVLAQALPEVEQELPEDTQPLRSLRGLWKDLNFDISAEEIDRARHEKPFRRGSLSSAVHGVMRATLDADLVADLRLEHVWLSTNSTSAWRQTPSPSPPNGPSATVQPCNRESRSPRRGLARNSRSPGQLRFGYDS